MASNMVSQILFGEYVEVLSIRTKHCIKVRCLFDHLKGYIDPKQILFFEDQEMTPSIQNHAVNMELSHPAFSTDLSINILLGSSLPGFDGISFYLDKRKFSFSGQAMIPQQELVPQDLFLKVLRRFLMAPELAGGRTIFGIDSGALTQLVFKIFNIPLPRYAAYQVEFGKTIFFARESQIGDLVFCANKLGDVDHVGIVFARKQIIHVHGKVRIDKLDHHGIFNEDERRYTHRVRIIKRIENWIAPAVIE